jgi:hypothetical protein
MATEPSPQAYRKAAAIAYDALMRLAERDAIEAEQAHTADAA